MKTKAFALLLTVCVITGCTEKSPTPALDPSCSLLIAGTNATVEPYQGSEGRSQAYAVLVLDHGSFANLNPETRVRVLSDPKGPREVKGVLGYVGDTSGVRYVDICVLSGEHEGQTGHVSRFNLRPLPTPGS